MMPDVFFLVFAHRRYVHQIFAQVCDHNGNFMVIGEP